MTNIKTPIGELKYVFVKGEGRNQALPGAPENFQYVCSIVFPENSPEHKALLEKINEEWEAYKTLRGVKGKPKTNGIKIEMKPDPDGTIDPETEEVRKIPTGNIIATFKTNITWPDGSPKKVKIFDHKGREITEIYERVPWSIGNGSTGIIFGVASANDIGGTHKVSLYLNAIQIAKLVKYEGMVIDAEEIPGEDIPIEDEDTGVPAV